MQTEYIIWNTYTKCNYSACKDAIQCRPCPPPPLSYTSSEPISNIFTFLESLGQMIMYIWSAVFFLNFENFWAKKQNHTEMRRGSTWCETYTQTRTSRSFKVSNWDILEFRSQFEIRTFIFLNTLDYGTLIIKEIEPISNNFDFSL